MRNAVLVHKIERLLDLKGEVAGCESVAAEYAGAVRELRLFVEDVSEALASRQYPDAAQKILARPPVTREIAALRFGQLDAWQAFCAGRKIETPVFPPQEQCDAIDAFLKSPVAAEPVQKLYRKAIRTKDTALLVRTLRILLEADKSRSWASDLALAEETRIKELVKEFGSLENAGENEKAAMTAEALLDDSWLTPPGAETTGQAKAFLAAQDAEMLAREQEEVLDLLRVCLEDWNADKARAYVGYLDKMSSSGTPVPVEDAAVVAAARKRCEDEEKAAAFDAAWRAASEKLFVAVEHEDPAEIRAAIGAVEFLDRPPEEELYRKAGLVIAHDDAKKRQKLRIIAGSALAAVLLVLGVSVYFIMNRNFNIRCDEEAKNLELLCDKPGDINTLDDLLSKIAVEVPKVWNDPRVQKYVHKLDEKKGEQARKLEELSTSVTAFEQLAANDWKDVDDRETEAKISAVEKALRDVAHRSLDAGRNEVAERLKAIRPSFDSYAAHCLERRIAAAEESFKVLLPKMTEAGVRLKSELLAGQLAAVVTNCEAEAENWKTLYSECSPDLLAKLEAADFTVEKKKSADAVALFRKLYAAETAEAALQARNELRELYAEFRQVAELKELNYQASDVATLLAEGSANQKALAEFVSGISGEPSEQRFEIVRESIANAGEVLGEFNGIRFEVKEWPSYILFLRGGPDDFAISRVDGVSKIRGDIFGYQDGSVLKSPSPLDVERWRPTLRKYLKLRIRDDLQVEGIARYADFIVEPFESARDLQDIRMMAKSVNPSVASLGQVIAQKVSKMLKAATADDYIQKQKKFVFEKGNTLNAYRTVQMLNAYFDWLVKLKIMPNNSETADIMDECRNLALWPIEINTSSLPRDVKNKENLYWLFMENANVARHNEKCAWFVRGLTKNDILMNIGHYRSLAPRLRNIGNWRVEFAGVLAMGDGEVVNPKCEENSVTLYILRKRGEVNVLVPVLAPGEDGWRQGPALAGCSTGEPLFRFANAAGSCDFYRELAKSAETCPPSVIKHVRKIFSADGVYDAAPQPESKPKPPPRPAPPSPKPAPPPKPTVGAPYCVIDLSGGPSARSYPVTYLAAEPVGGFNVDEYKTTKLVLRRIEPGTFKMCGSCDVTLTKSFYMGLFEVTQKQWELVMGENPSQFKGDKRPVEQVSYNTIRGPHSGTEWPNSSAVDSTSFMGKLRARTGVDFDFPTEAQWEYACRAGKSGLFNNGGSDDSDLKLLGRYSNDCGDGKGEYADVHTTVGSYLPNAWGLYDMHGNVWEWCLDWHADRLNASADPRGALSGNDRVIRGGSWPDSSLYCRANYRGIFPPSRGENNKGFRLCRTLR